MLPTARVHGGTLALYLGLRLVGRLAWLVKDWGRSLSGVLSIGLPVGRRWRLAVAAARRLALVCFDQALVVISHHQQSGQQVCSCYLAGHDAPVILNTSGLKGYH